MANTEVGGIKNVTEVVGGKQQVERKKSAAPAVNIFYEQRKQIFEQKFQDDSASKKPGQFGAQLTKAPPKESFFEERVQALYKD